MKPLDVKWVLQIAIWFFMTITSCHAQEPTVLPGPKKWLIALPLRFTHLQNNNTMLSGIKLGRRINSELSTSVYHSFYLKSFKSEADLDGFETQPRLFINCVGTELEYTFFKGKKLDGNLQFMAGWGFVKYDLKKYNFKSRQVNYIALEPSVNIEYNLNGETALGLGLGYRSIPGNKNIYYSSSINSGEIPVGRTFPNGLIISLTIKGHL